MRPPPGEPTGRTGAEPRPADLSLLRQYEPVLRFTAGELFLPMPVERYVAECSLWATGPGRSAELLVPAGELTLDRLGDLGEQHRHRLLSLRLVQRPLSRREVRAWWRRTRPRLQGTARLAAVGAVARLVDVLLRVSLLVRGRVPRGLVAAAQQLTATDPAAATCPWYGRVVEDGGYLVLQYWYFYAFNDWRSTFHGVNDHEADWETVAVHLVVEDGRLRPAWVAASSHDHDGALLRRRWDDPTLSREGDHPVVFPGAGSHSGAFVAADYVVSVELPALRRALDALRGRRPGTRPRAPGTFALPFVDHARGDGAAVGPGHDRGWQPELISDGTPWVVGFRGLWGLDTHDPLGGERAPAGPRYERSGAVRRAWSDPLGWAGLATVAPTPAEDRAALRARLAELTDRLGGLDRAIAEARTSARGLRAQAASLAAAADTRPLQRERTSALRAGEVELRDLVAERTRLLEECAAHTATLSRPPAAEAPDAHLALLPAPAVVSQHRRLLRGWAAVSTPVLVLWIGVLLTQPTAASFSGFGVFLAVFAAVEAVARGRTRLVLIVGAALAVWVGVVAGLVFAVLRNWQVGVAVLLTVLAVGLLAANVRELAGRPGRRPGGRRER